MLNQVVLVGRLTKDVELITLSDNREVANIVLAIPRSYKNKNGVYDTDFIRCSIWDVTAKNVQNYCKKGDVIGIRGRIQTNTVENDDKKHTYIEVVGEKISFLSTKK